MHNLPKACKFGFSSSPSDDWGKNSQKVSGSWLTREKHQSNIDLTSRTALHRAQIYSSKTGMQRSMWRRVKTRPRLLISVIRRKKWEDSTQLFAVFTLEDGKLVMTGFSSDEFPVWYKFVNRNLSSFYRHEFIYRRKRDGKHRKFVRKKLGPEIWVYLYFRRMILLLQSRQAPFST